MFFIPFALTLLLATISGCSGSDTDLSDMVFIPAGSFVMGNSSESALPDQRPAHQVYLDAYYIDKYEVTNQEYEAFIMAGGYQKRKFWLDEGWQFIQRNKIQNHLGLNKDLYNAPDQPVIGVSWYEADAYCRWAGKRLPTEAEWEKAARGAEGFLYPWGNEMIFENIAYNIANGKRTVPVGSFLNNASPYGVMDMAGNVWEWCADWYDETSYSKSPSKNPKGPEKGSDRVLRGGSWVSTRMQLQSTYRYHHLPVHRGFTTGFRCVKDVK